MSRSDPRRRTILRWAVTVLALCIGAVLPYIRQEVTVALAAVTYAFVAVVFMAWHLEVGRLVRERGAAAARLTLVGRAANDVIYEWDIPSGAFVLSEAAAAQLGYDKERNLARGWWDERLHAEDAGPVKDALATVLKTKGREWETEYRFRKADGTFTTVHDHSYVQWSGGRKPKPLRMVGTLVNVDSVSLYDPITGLAGRAVFTDRVERRAVRDAIGGGSFGVIVMEIEGLQALTQESAKETLVELARRLETYLGTFESAARIGPDQLAFLVNAANADDVVARAAQIRDSARIPFTVDSKIRFDVVAGAAVLPQGGTPDLMRQALAALADAKRTKRRVVVYEPGGEKRWEERVRLRDDLATALERKELVLYFQPIADASTGRCVALEALVRWDHESLGMLDAGDLLQVASDLDLGGEIDRWVIGEATRAVSQLRKVRGDLGLSVNVAVRSLDADFPGTVRALLAASQLPSEALTIELPEDTTLRTSPADLALAELRALGVGIAIDDFATGYASLLPEPITPATVVKIDRVFAGRVANDEHATRVVRSAVARAKELGLRIVGEGVEDTETIAVLRGLGVDLVQGRGVATPMPLVQVTAWLQGAPIPVGRVKSQRPVMIGENEARPAAAASGPAVFGAFGQSGSDLITDFVPTDLFAPAPASAIASVVTVAQPFGPDPMGWVLPQADTEAGDMEPDFATMRARAFTPSYAPDPFAAAQPESQVQKRADRGADLLRQLVVREREPEPVVIESVAVEPEPMIEPEQVMVFEPEPVIEPEPVFVAAEAEIVSQEDPRVMALHDDPRVMALQEDPRVVALRPSHDDPRLDALRRRHHSEETDRLDERIVLLRQHALRQSAGSVAS